MDSTSRLVINNPTCLSTDPKKKAVNQCGDRSTAVADEGLHTDHDLGFSVTHAGWSTFAGGSLGCFFVMNVPRFEPGKQGWRVSLRCVRRKGFVASGGGCCVVL